MVRLAVTAAVLALPGPAWATHASVRWAGPDTNAPVAAGDVAIADDGSRVLFQTTEPVTLDDIDGGQNSIYELSAAGVRLLTQTPAGAAASALGVTPDARRMVIETTGSLAGTDTDGLNDVYLVTDGVPEHVSTGTGTQAAFAHGISDDGTTVFFSTAEDLTGEGDGASDVYRWESGLINVLSDIGAGFALAASYRGHSRDGTKVWFETSEGLDGTDNDGAIDVYQGDAGGPTLLSGVGGGVNAAFSGASGDGSRVFFRTVEALAGDTDANEDVFQSIAGAITLMTPGTAAQASTWVGASQDGAKMWFTTLQSLAAADTDAEHDLYQRSGTTTTPVSENGSASLAGAAQWGGASTDGTKVWFTAVDNLAAGDTDGLNDVYEWDGATFTVVSTPTPAASAVFDGASADGSRVFFSTTEPIDAGDAGFDDDVYERYRGATWLVSPGTTLTGATLSNRGVSPNGRFLAIVSTESLDPADTDGEDDVYRVAIPAAGAATGDPAAVGETAATLTGSVTSQNELSSYVFEYGKTTAYGSQTGVSPVAFGAATEAVSRGVSGLEPGTTYHYRLVAANIGGTSAGVDRAFTTAAPAQAPGGQPPGGQPPPPSVPPPVLSRTFNAEPVSGRVLARVPGTTRFVPIERLTSLPAGTIVDTRRGRVRLFAADGKGGIQSAEFYEGVFRLLQPARGRGLVELHLFGGSFTGCGRAVKPAGAAAGKKTRSVRHLWGDGRGRFRTVGRFSSATLRGTQWLTDDRCDGTVTRVTKGSVTVRDFVKRRSLVLRAPKRYLALRRR